MVQDQHTEPEPVSDEQASTYVPPGISTRRPTDLEHFSIRGRRL